jgi:hypothetical protein
VLAAVALCPGPGNRRIRRDGHVQRRRAGGIHRSAPRHRHGVLAGGSHDAHLDDTAEWATALRGVLDTQAEP